jgi:GSCFA family
MPCKKNQIQYSKMKFQINFPIAQQQTKIAYPDKISLIGSCFTEHIGKRFAERKFDIVQNAHGILFNPVSVCSSLRDVMRCQVYEQAHLFYLDEMWHSWMFHSKFSDFNPQQALQKMNTSVQQAHLFLQQSNWLIITLGSAFAYRHNELDMHVSNNHRGPADWFTKELLDIQYIQNIIQQTVSDLQQFNPGLKIIFTISPVRHLRDGIVQNNQSKARLIESVHEVVTNNAQCFYFPSYEIVIDELRDYRFYDIDFAHPNYAATEYVWQRFKETAIEKKEEDLMEQLHTIHLAMQHKPFHAQSKAHLLFLSNTLEKCLLLQKQFPYLNLSTEIKYFSV